MPIYIALSCWILLIAAIKPNTLFNNIHTSKFLFWAFFILTSALVLSNLESFLTGPDSIPDTIIYAKEFLSYAGVPLSDAISTQDREPFFVFFTWLISQFTDSHTIYFLAVWILIALVTVSSLRHAFNQPWKTLLVFFTFVNFPFFLTYVVNGVRQGFAMSFILLAICLLLSGKKKRFLFLLVLALAIFSHKSALPFALIVLGISLFKNFPLKLSVAIWSFSSLLFLTGLNSSLLMPLSSIFDELASYTSSDALQRYSGTNRPDFLLFSFIFIAIGLYLYRRTIDVEKAKYKMLLNIYILFNTVFVLLGFIAFSNRLSAYSWFLIPLLVWYPILNIGESKKYNSPIILVLTLMAILIGLFTSPSNILF